MGVYNEKTSASMAGTKITFDDIADVIREEGWESQRLDDMLYVTILDIDFYVFYKDEKLSVVTFYDLDESDDFNVVLRACSCQVDSSFLIRANIGETKDRGPKLIFQVQTLIYSRYELERYLGAYFKILIIGISRFQEIYEELIAERLAHGRKNNCKTNREYGQGQ